MSISREVIKCVQILNEGRFWGYQSDSSIARVLASGILFFDPSENKVLLGLRGATLNSGSWGVFGGKVDEGESPRDSAVREVEEELGSLPEGRFTGGEYRFEIPLNTEDYIEDAGLYARDGDKFVYITYLYEVEDATDWEPVLNWEHKEVRWFDVNSLPNNMLHLDRGDGVRYPVRESIEHLVGNKVGR